MIGKILCLSVILLNPVSLWAQDTIRQRYEAGIVFTAAFLERIGTRDVGIGTETGGIGGRFVYHQFRFLDFKGELNFLPGNSATAGNHLQGFAGVKAGWRNEWFGAFVKVRPGFIHFRRDPLGVGKPGTNFPSHVRAHSTEPSVDFGVVVEHYRPSGFIFRFDLGKSVIDYAPRTVVTSQFVPPLEAGGFRTWNWQGSFGVGVRF